MAEESANGRESERVESGWVKAWLGNYGVEKGMYCATPSNNINCYKLNHNELAVRCVEELRGFWRSQLTSQ